jgi:hypothetical protein
MDATLWTSAIIAAVIAILALLHPGKPAVNVPLSWHRTTAARQLGGA